MIGLMTILYGFLKKFFSVLSAEGKTCKLLDIKETFWRNLQITFLVLPMSEIQICNDCQIGKVQILLN